MSRTPFDVFCKQFLETFLSPIGTVNINREIPGESANMKLHPIL